MDLVVAPTSRIHEKEKGQNLVLQNWFNNLLPPVLSEAAGYVCFCLQSIVV